jgi:hypothetical protein
VAENLFSLAGKFIFSGVKINSYGFSCLSAVAAKHFISFVSKSANDLYICDII